MKFHALAKGKAPGLSIDQLPLGGECRLDLEVRSVADEALVDMIEKSEVGCGRDRIGIERIEIGATTQRRVSALAGTAMAAAAMAARTKLLIRDI